MTKRYREQLSRRLYTTLLATKLATRLKPFATTPEIKRIIGGYDTKGAVAAGSTLESLSQVHKLIEVEKSHCNFSDRRMNKWRVNSDGNNFLKRNISTQSQHK